MTCLHSSASETYKVNAPKGLNVRSFPGTQSHILGLLENGSSVEVSNIYEGWGQITYRGSTGYVSMEYLALDVPISSQSLPHGSGWLPIFIMVFAFGGCYLMGHDYLYWGIGVSVLNLLLVWYQLDATPWPLWFVTERGVGLGWMLINMFLMFITIGAIWLSITVMLSMLYLDTYTIWGVKILFVLRIFSPVPLLMTLLIIWAIGFAIYNCIQSSYYTMLVRVIIGAIVIAILVNGGGAICAERFHGLDAVILIAGVIPSVFQFFVNKGYESSYASASGGGLEQYEVYDSESNKRRTLTQSSKYSKCNFRDEDGNDWEYYNGQFNKRHY